MEEQVEIVVVDENGAGEPIVVEAKLLDENNDTPVATEVLTGEDSEIVTQTVHIDNEVEVGVVKTSDESEESVSIGSDDVEDDFDERSETRVEVQTTSETEGAPTAEATDTVAHSIERSSSWDSRSSSSSSVSLDWSETSEKRHAKLADDADSVVPAAIPEEQFGADVAVPVSTGVSIATPLPAPSYRSQNFSAPVASSSSSRVSRTVTSNAGPVVTPSYQLQSSPIGYSSGLEKRPTVVPTGSSQISSTRAPAFATGSSLSPYTTGTSSVGPMRTAGTYSTSNSGFPTSTGTVIHSNTTGPSVLSSNAVPSAFSTGTALPSYKPTYTTQHHVSASDALSSQVMPSSQPYSTFGAPSHPHPLSTQQLSFPQSAASRPITVSQTSHPLKGSSYPVVTRPVEKVISSEPLSTISPARPQVLPASAPISSHSVTHPTSRYLGAPSSMQPSLSVPLVSSGPTSVLSPTPVVTTSAPIASRRHEYSSPIPPNYSYSGQSPVTTITKPYSSPTPLVANAPDPLANAPVTNPYHQNPAYSMRQPQHVTVHPPTSNALHPPISNVGNSSSPTRLINAKPVVQRQTSITSDRAPAGPLRTRVAPTYPRKPATYPSQFPGTESITLLQQNRKAGTARPPPGKAPVATVKVFGQGSPSRQQLPLEKNKSVLPQKFDEAQQAGVFDSMLRRSGMDRILPSIYEQMGKLSRVIQQAPPDDHDSPPPPSVAAVRQASRLSRPGSVAPSVRSSAASVRSVGPSVRSSTPSVRSQASRASGARPSRSTQERSSAGKRRPEFPSPYEAPPGDAGEPDRALWEIIEARNTSKPPEAKKGLGGLVAWCGCW